MAPLLGFLCVTPGRADEPYSRFIARTPPRSAAEQRTAFHLPPGFTIELVANEPDIRKPINLNFDAAGRLLVTTSVEYPFPAVDRPRDTVTLLVDSDRDGTFDRIQPFVSELNIPVGVTAAGRSVVAYSIPHILRFSDEDADGRADRSHGIYTGFDSADTHGMPSSFTYGIDGWIYACHGEGNTSRVTGADHHAITLCGGNTFRMRPDGSRIEHFAYGQVNPFGLCFDAWGDLFSADSHSRPATLLLRGATYPSPLASDDGFGFGPPIMSHHHNSTGIGGIAFYAADQFPEPYRNSLFIGNPVTGRINHDRLEVRGSTYVAVEQPDFLTCDDPWFRPVDLRVGPDGALYIADFYNRIIAHTLVPLGHVDRDRAHGRIWRVVHARGNTEPGSPLAPIVAPPDLATASRDELLTRLGHPNLVVRTLATHELVERIGSDAVAPLRDVLTGTCHVWQRVHGIWVLDRLGSLDDALITRLASDEAPIVRVQAMKVLAERSTWSPVADSLHRLVLDRLADASPMVRRAAADALARHPSAVNVGPLLVLWEGTPADDTMLIHVARLALRESLGDGRAIGEFAQRVSAVDQRRLADVSLGIPTSHSASFLFERLRAGLIDADRLSRFIYHAARYADADVLGQLMEFSLTYRQGASETQVAVLTSLYRAATDRKATVPAGIAEWALALASQLLDDADEGAVYQGLELAWELQLTSVSGRLEQLADKATPVPSLRSFAIDALGAVARGKAVPFLDRTLNDATDDDSIREKAADALGKIDGDPSRVALENCLATAPANVALAIARALVHGREGAEWFVQAIERGRASGHLLHDAVVDQRLRAHAIDDLDARLDAISAGLPSLDDRLPQRIQAHRDRFAAATPDAARGAMIFEKYCAPCHQVANRGSRIGPSLDGVGHRGVERILEDILDPHRNVDVAFRATTVRLATGRILTGLVAREDNEGLMIVDTEGRETRFPVDDIDERKLLRLSPMPANLAETIPAPDFDHLLAFLLSQRGPIGK